MAGGGVSSCDSVYSVGCAKACAAATWSVLSSVPGMGVGGCVCVSVYAAATGSATDGQAYPGVRTPGALAEQWQAAEAGRSGRREHKGAQGGTPGWQTPGCTHAGGTAHRGHSMQRNEVCIVHACHVCCTLCMPPPMPPSCNGTAQRSATQRNATQRHSAPHRRGARGRRQGVWDQGQGAVSGRSGRNRECQGRNRECQVRGPLACRSNSWETHVDRQAPQASRWHSQERR
jgi:hypothetical protein